MILGVLGGSGLYDIDGLADRRSEVVSTPFGAPSGLLVSGRLGEARVVFLPRHGAGHRLSPSEINYRANVCALKAAGATRVLSVSAVGSLREGMPPGDLVLVDQFIDKKFRRRTTFFDEGVVGVGLAGDVPVRLTCRSAVVGSGPEETTTVPDAALLDSLDSATVK